MTWLWYAVAALMLVDAVGHMFGAIGPIRRALNLTEPYRQKRLLLSLMLAKQGLYLGAAIPLVGARFELTLATCIDALVTSLLLTPRDSGHAVPRDAVIRADVRAAAPVAAIHAGKHGVAMAWGLLPAVPSAF